MFPSPSPEMSKGERLTLSRVFCYETHATLTQETGAERTAQYISFSCKEHTKTPRKFFPFFCPPGFFPLPRLAPKVRAGLRRGKLQRRLLPSPPEMRTSEKREGFFKKKVFFLRSFLWEREGSFSPRFCVGSLSLSRREILLWPLFFFFCLCGGPCSNCVSNES